MFGSPAVKVSGYQEYKEEILGACQAIFGQPLLPEDFAELIAAPDGSELLIAARHVDGDIELRLGYQWFNGTHDYILYVDQESGKRVVEFDNIAVRDEAPELLETRLFARQVRSFHRFSVDEIRLFAAGYANHPGKIGGYYVRPRLGFIVDLGGLGAELAQAGFQGADHTLELFSQAGGAKWWYNHGSERPAVFYLYEGSPCVLALQLYLEETGVNVDA